MTLSLFILVLALVLLVLAAGKCPELPHLSFGWAGMALWMLATVLGPVSLR